MKKSLTTVAMALAFTFQFLQSALARKALPTKRTATERRPKIRSGREKLPEAERMKEAESKRETAEATTEQKTAEIRGTKRRRRPNPRTIMNIT